MQKLTTQRRLLQKSQVKPLTRGLIELRKNHPAFRMTTAEEISEHLIFMDMPKEEMIGYQISNYANGDEWEEIVVLFNANKEEAKIVLDQNGWDVMVNDKIAGITPIETITGNEVSVPSRSAFVLVKSKEEPIIEQEKEQNETTKPQDKRGMYIIGGAAVTVMAGLGVRRKLKNQNKVNH